MTTLSAASSTLPDMSPSPGGPTLTPEADHDGVTFERVDLSGQDGSGSRYIDCVVDTCVLDDVSLHGSRLVDTALRGVSASALTLTDCGLQDVLVAGSRIGGLQAYGSELVRVTVRGGKIDYLNLRGATLHDVVLDGCVVGDLDLGEARVARLRVEGCRVERLHVTGTSFEKSDLRGADLSAVEGLAGLAGVTISPAQLHALAPALAAHLGIRVE